MTLSRSRTVSGRARAVAAGLAVVSLAAIAGCDIAATPSPAPSATATYTTAPSATPLPTEITTVEPTVTPTPAATPTPTPTPGGTASVGHLVPAGSMLFNNSEAVLLDDGRVMFSGGSECSSTGTCRMLPDTELYNPTTKSFVASKKLTSLSGVEKALLLPLARKPIFFDGTIVAMVYDPAGDTVANAGSWIPPGGDPGGPNVGTFAVAPLNNGKILIAGGWVFPGTTNMSELYDPGCKCFSPTGKLIHDRAQAQAVKLADGRVLVIGGDSGPLGGSTTILSSAELYDASGAAASTTGAMTTPREGFVAVLLKSGKVLVAGGYRNAAGTPALDTAELYDPTTGTFTATGSMKVARSASAAALLADGRVLVVGGQNGNHAVATTEIYDPATGTFTLGPSLPWAKAWPTATTLQNGTVLITGGKSVKPQVFIP